MEQVQRSASQKGEAAGASPLVTAFTLDNLRNSASTVMQHLQDHPEQVYAALSKLLQAELRRQMAWKYVMVRLLLDETRLDAAIHIAVSAVLDTLLLAFQQLETSEVAKLAAEVKRKAQEAYSRASSTAVSVSASTGQILLQTIIDNPKLVSSLLKDVLLEAISRLTPVPLTEWIIKYILSRPAVQSAMNSAVDNVVNALIAKFQQNTSPVPRAKL